MIKNIVFLLTSFQKWREEILFQEARLIALTALGYWVLNTTTVATVACVLKKRLSIHGG